MSQHNVHEIIQPLPNNSGGGSQPVCCEAVYTTVYIK